MAKNYSGKKDNTVVFMVLAVVIVLALGVYAVYGVIGDKIAQNKAQKVSERVSSGEATVEELADINGKTVDELLASYGVSAEDGVDGNTGMMDFADKLTLEKYCEFTGVEYNEEDFAAYKAENGLGDDITAQTKDEEVKEGYVMYAYNKALEEQQTQAGTESAETEPDTEVAAE